MKLSALLEQQFNLPSIPKVVALLLVELDQPEVDVNNDDIEDAFQDLDEDEIYGEELNCFKSWSNLLITSLRSSSSSTTLPLRRARVRA